MKYLPQNQWAIFHDDDAFMNYNRFYRISKATNGSDVERLYCLANEDWETKIDKDKFERPIPRIPGRDGKWGFSVDVLPFGYIYIRVQEYFLIFNILQDSFEKFYEKIHATPISPLTVMVRQLQYLSRLL